LLGYRVNAKLSAYFGAEPGFLLKIKANRFTSERIGNDSKKWDVGLDVGTTYNLTPKWMIDVRYNYGIKTVAWKSYPLESNYDGISKNGFNRGLQLALSCFILD
jgi:opacity protein-like surface antigen